MPGRKPRITDLAELARLDAELTIAELAEHFGCNIETVRRTRARIGLPERRPRMTDERKAQIQTRLSDGWSHAEIARTEGVDPDTLRRHFPGTAWSKDEVRRHATTVSQHAYEMRVRRRELKRLTYVYKEKGDAA